MSEPVRGRLGHSVSLQCKVKGEVTVTLSHWTRCNDSYSIAVFYPRSNSTPIANVMEPYMSRVSIEEYHTLNINPVQDGDFGKYCCKVTTFPQGSLEGRVQLLKYEEQNEEVDKPKSPPAGLPVMMIVYITCGVLGFVILTGITVLVFKTKRRSKVRNPMHVTVTPASLTPKQPSLLHTPRDFHTPSHAPSHTPRREDKDDDDYDDDMYLTVTNLEP
ncbi:uncharacterized protein LOC128603624 [Ictalurus furcatus]|uniref:uncharacterized protein LOC128603624 n=1 Tax=Ictalurus furcatus TaxID=66913 RepID=UPI0023506282|nr:uncharacterized protein LOC128603624 [Ictalurus furcatus]